MNNPRLPIKLVCFQCKKLFPLLQFLGGPFFWTWIDLFFSGDSLLEENFRRQTEPEWVFDRNWPFGPNIVPVNPEPTALHTIKYVRYNSVYFTLFHPGNTEFKNLHTSSQPRANSFLQCVDTVGSVYTFKCWAVHVQPVVTAHSICSQASQIECQRVKTSLGGFSVLICKFTTLINSALVYKNRAAFHSTIKINLLDSYDLFQALVYFLYK